MTLNAKKIGISFASMLAIVRIIIAISVTIVYFGVFDGYVFAESNDLTGYESPFMIVRPIDWAGANTRSKQAYFHSVLETYGFVLYRHLPPSDPQREQNYSDYKECVDKNKNRKWPLFSWLWGKNLKASAAAQLIRNEIPLVCQEYTGKGDGRREPPRVVSKQEWQSYSNIERKFYVSGYIESSLELMVLQQNREDINQLTECVNEKGPTAVLTKLKNIDVEWRYPMPWTISKSLGAACLS